MTNEKEIFKENFSEYDPDIHYPILLKITRPEEEEYSKLSIVEV